MRNRPTPACGRRPHRRAHPLLVGAAAATAVAAIGVAGSAAWGAEDGPHGRLRLAQAGAPAQQAPRHAGTGIFAQVLPRGAAAPTSNERPPIYANFGDFGWPGASARPEAQAIFDQGYRFAWAFNHGEAVRNFRAAQQLDPACAACFWGEAWALGPNINYFMEPAANARALAALAQARQLATRADPRRAALIEALSQRHSPDPQADRAALDAAFAGAMLEVQRRFPDDPHIAVLTADALMNTQPWDYWADGGRAPKGHAATIVALLEGVLGERPNTPIGAMPDHPGAIHLYIHAVEASDRPERAARHAERLEALIPGSGHIAHMPSHIWLRLGHWRDVLEANRRAVAANEALIAMGGQSLVLSEAYYPHNIHFLVQAAMMGGDGPTAVEAAQRLAQRVSSRAQQEIPWVQPIAAALYVAHARFSEPETILSMAPPDERFPFVGAHWRYARGVALARLGRAQDAEAEAVAIAALVQAPQVKALEALFISAGEILTIAAHVVRARVAQQAGEHGRAASLFREAAAVQDRLPYMEPPFWHFPVHQSLGAALLAAGRPKEAEAAFRAALERVPNNGWAAAGLLRAAEAQDDPRSAQQARALLERSWFGGEPPALDRL